ncbi:hypothetical protein SAMN06265360_107184 [Haloechinothrix alba]|uniref:Uncharacterized protein n=1 Tax=Haloechinothrix alba TaxID=664784 RepID=A0A238WTC5_9PSEU|nr:hypothetical protein [Haloechinothrix alba]SNR49631.1 hypothetical protein SAMN06265360_107184 [Haloechinothrix alba]
MTDEVPDVVPAQWQIGEAIRGFRASLQEALDRPEDELRARVRDFIGDLDEAIYVVERTKIEFNY